ncbi:MAG: hypothetical protein Q9219_004519 [cf. Caloplaca sp. 3 TL-2023]
MHSTVKVAVTQAEPAWLDLPAAVKKTCDLIAEAAGKGCKLIAFPECWIPGARPVDFHLSTRYLQNSLPLNSPSMRTIQSCARDHAIAVVLGFAENDHDSLYIAQALIAPTGEILMRRRKIKPTHMERTIFGDGSGSSLSNVAEVDGVGRVGALACWEHGQPLLKYNTFCQHEEVHVSAWPPLDPHPGDGPGLWSVSREGCTSLCQTYAVEGAAFVLMATAVFSAQGLEMMRSDEGVLFTRPGGGCSAVFGPDGRRLTEAMPPMEEGLVVAELEAEAVLRARCFVDCVGHYSRPDLLWLGVDGREKRTRVGRGEEEDVGVGEEGKRGEE